MFVLAVWKQTIFVFIQYICTQFKIYCSALQSATFIISAVHVHVLGFQKTTFCIYLDPEIWWKSADGEIVGRTAH